MTYLPPSFDPPSLETILFTEPGEPELDQETQRQLLADREGMIAEQFRSIRSGLQTRPGIVYLPFGGLVGSLTNQALAEDFLDADNAYIIPFDLTGFTQARLVARVTTASTSANTPILSAKYDAQAGGFSTTVTDYADLGASPLTVSLASTGAKDTGWGQIAPAAKDEDVYLTVTMSGGDGAADPALGPVGIVLR